MLYADEDDGICCLRGGGGDGGGGGAGAGAAGGAGAASSDWGFSHSSLQYTMPSFTSSLQPGQFPYAMQHSSLQKG